MHENSWYISLFSFLSPEGYLATIVTATRVGKREQLIFARGHAGQTRDWPAVMTLKSKVWRLMTKIKSLCNNDHRRSSKNLKN